MPDRRSQPLIEALTLVSPGSPLREGLDQVLRAKGGALVVIGDHAAVLSICTGGFLLDAEFTPQRLSELAKMDGAIVLAPDASRIARANVHLMPKSTIHTSETGTRHRTAERVARSIDVPVVSVSEEMSTIAVYCRDRKHVLLPRGRLVDRASQALSTMRQFKIRFDQAVATLSSLEAEDTVSVRDVVDVLQPAVMVTRIASEVEGYLVELGEDGRLIRLQLEELSAGVSDALQLVLRDYLPRAPAPSPNHAPARPSPPAGARSRRDAVSGSSGAPEVPDRRDAPDGRDAPALPAGRDGRYGRYGRDGAKGSRGAIGDRDLRAASQAVGGALEVINPDELLDPVRVAGILGLGTGVDVLDASLESRGYRLLHRLPRLSDVLIDRLVERFGSLAGVMTASVADLEQVSGVGVARARLVKDGLARMVEASILERYG